MQGQGFVEQNPVHFKIYQPPPANGAEVQASASAIVALITQTNCPAHVTDDHRPVRLPEKRHARVTRRTNHPQTEQRCPAAAGIAQTQAASDDSPVSHA